MATSVYISEPAGAKLPYSDPQSNICLPLKAVRVHSLRSPLVNIILFSHFTSNYIIANILLISLYFWERRTNPPPVRNVYESLSAARLQSYIYTDTLHTFLGISGRWSEYWVFLEV